MMSVLYYEGYGELKKRTPNNPIFACLSFLELNFPKVIPQRQLSSKKDMILKTPDSAHLSAFILSSTLYWIFLFSYGKVIELFRPLNNTANSKEPQYLLLQEIKFWLKSYLLQYLCNIILLRRLTRTVFQNILKGYLRIRQKKKSVLKETCVNVKNYPQVHLQLVGSYLSGSRQGWVTASLLSALVNSGSSRLSRAGRTREKEARSGPRALPPAPRAATPAPLPLLTNGRCLLCTVTAQFTLVNNKLGPSKVTLILNEIVHRCLNTITFLYVHFTSWGFKVILITLIDFTREDGSSDFSESWS